MADRRIVCIVAPRSLAQSQTFVKDHATRLPADVRLLFGRRPDAATTHADGKPAFLRRWFVRGNFPARHAHGEVLVSPTRRAVDLALRGLLRLRTQPLSDAVLARHLREQRVEAVLAEFGPMGVHVMRACAAARVPLVVHFHGFDAYRKRLLRKHRTAYRELFSIAAAIVAVSRDMVEQLGELGAPEEKLFLNPCGVDVGLFHGADPAAVPARFLAVGRFIEKKAPHFTLLAFQKLLEIHPQAHLVMVGDGPLMPQCRKLVESLGIEHAVSFPGVLSHAEVADTMRGARAFVQHSVRSRCGDREGTPVAVLEASASGLPVVSTRHGGIKDAVIHGMTGLLVNEGDVEGMARCLRVIADAPERARVLGSRGRDHVRAHYGMEARVAALGGILERAIRGGRADIDGAHEASRAAA